MLKNVAAFLRGSLIPSAGPLWGQAAWMADWAGIISGGSGVLYLLWDRFSLAILSLTPLAGHPWTAMNFSTKFGFDLLIFNVFAGWISFGVSELALVVYVLHRHERARLPWLGIIGTLVAAPAPWIDVHF